MTLLTILFFPFFGSFVSLYLGRLNEKLRDVSNLFISTLTLLLILAIYPEVKLGTIAYELPNIMGTGLHLRVGMLQYVLILLTAVLFLVTLMYSVFYLTKHKNRNRYYLCYMLTYSFVLGIFMSENLLNLFTFFEAMTFSSYLLVIHDEDAFSHEAGASYLAMAITGGLVMLMGILVAFDYTNTLIISEMSEKMLTLAPGLQRLIGSLIVIGFGVKASMFPLHTWLPKAYVASPTPATAVLSGVLLKTGLYGMYIASVVLVTDFGLCYAMICLGAVNALLGGFLAVNQRNVKRIIAYSSMSQAGFMIIAIGILGIVGHEGGLAFLATMLFMVNHGISKVLLFLVVGVVIYWTKELSLTNIWGVARQQWLLKVAFVVGAMGTMGFPGFNGFLSKSLFHEAIIEAYHVTHTSLFIAIEWVYYISSVLTVAYMVKLYIALFASRNEVYEVQAPKQINYKASISLIILSLGVMVIGLFPETFMAPIKEAMPSLGYNAQGIHSPYQWASIFSACLVFLLGNAVYYFYVKRTLIHEVDGERTYLNQTINWFNIENDFYRPLFKWTFKHFFKIFDFIDNWMTKIVITLRYFFVYISNLDATLLKRLEWDRVILDQSVNPSQYEIKDDLSVHKKPQSLKESFSSFYVNITSINYNVLFVTSVMVIIMVILYLVR